MSFMKIVLASNNKGKLDELQAMFAPLQVELIPQSALNVPEADEPYRTFVENALTKARNAARHSGLAALADDAGLCVDAFGGLPGVDTAYYCTQFGYEKSDANNVRASASEKGSTRSRRVTRLCKPPRCRTTFSSIHDAAEPQTTTTNHGCCAAHAFQKCSNAGKKPERRDASHGSSSKKTTRLPRFGLQVCNQSVNWRNAACQSTGGGADARPRPTAVAKVCANDRSCTANDASWIPTSSKQIAAA